MFCFYNFQTKTIESCFAVDSQDDSIENELSENVENILNDIDFSDIDDFLTEDFEVDYFAGVSFKDIVAGVLSGEYFTDYDGIIDFVVSTFKENFKSVIVVILSLLVIVFLSEMFKSFCADKYADFKKFFSVIFSLTIALFTSGILKDVAEMLSDVVNKIFKFSNILFPIILNLILISGASGSFSIYSSLSVFLLNTGSYIFVYVLLPISISILVLTLSASVFSSARFVKTIDILKTIFKYVIGFMFAVFGLLSVVNLFTVGVKDGVGLKLTKYAIKNYIPILGGYISDGFDFIHACSVLVKNAFGVCGILVLVFIVLKPLVVYFIYLLVFKILSLIVLYVGCDSYSDVFENVSKSMGYFVSVLVGVFLIMFVFIYLTIVSVSVV